MTSTFAGSEAVARARTLARKLLRTDSERWRHTVGVARRAEEVSVALPDDEDAGILVAAAWLHDIGYADELRDTGFHPLDGARHLTRERWPLRIGALVANHSGACFVAHARGLAAELCPYPDERSWLSDALTYADQTVGPNGRRMSIGERVADMLRRHGPDSPNALAHPRRGPHLLATAERVELRLAAARLRGRSAYAA